MTGVGLLPDSMPLAPAPSVLFEVYTLKGPVPTPDRGFQHILRTTWMNCNM